MSEYTLKFLRDANKFTGKLVLYEDGKEVLKTDARSGQPGAAIGETWVTGKSPIPTGNFFLHLRPVMQFGQLSPKRGDIGQAYYISDTDPKAYDYKSFRFEITNPRNRSQKRSAIMLHPENDYMGSAGCVVVLHDTPERKAALLKLFNILEMLATQKQVRRIMLTSIVV